MIGASFCTGIGAPEVAAPWIDWRLAAEISAFPREVIRARFGHVPAERLAAGAADPAAGGARVLWGDFTALRVRHYRRLGLPCPNLLAAGTPCQAFSFAGRRGGLADARGNLTLEFVNHVKALRAWSLSPRFHGRGLEWVLWENVPGVLSDETNAFGCLVSALCGGDSPFDPPAGGRWPDAGLADGPGGRAAWRILDAQRFGLAQRRRRVWLVVGLGEGADPAAVLFEPAGGGGDSPAGGAAGEGLA